MCFAVPGKVKRVEGGVALVDYRGEVREAGTALVPDLKEGEYVIVSARMVVQRVPEDDAEKVLSLWDATGVC